MGIVRVWQIDDEARKQLSKDDSVQAITAMMDGEFPFNVYKLVFEQEVEDVAFEQIKRDPFRAFNRVDGCSGYLEQYERVHGPVKIYSLSVGDIIQVGDEILRCKPIGWEVVTEAFRPWAERSAK